jgi:heme O synthase-like polyprenyltransferase
MRILIALMAFMFGLFAGSGGKNPAARSFMFGMLVVLALLVMMVVHSVFDPGPIGP